MTDESKNCCPSTLPPVVGTNYEPKGKFEEIEGLKTYITGSPTAARGIIDVYDIFGHYPQTLQGADRLAASLDAVVLIPDFLKGSYAQEEWFSEGPKDDATKAATAKFLQGLDFSSPVGMLLKVAETAKGKYPSAQSWGCFGLCWGGKVTALSSAADTPFKVSGQAHPGRPTKEDALAITIPHICLYAPSDNKTGGMDGYKEVFSQKDKIGEIEEYENMFHGWMGARANLEDAENVKEYERGYNQIASFFAKYL